MVQRKYDVNPNKFQAIIIGKKTCIITATSANDISINPKNSAKLLGLEIDSKLNFDKHITQLYKKCADQLNVLCILKSFLNTDQRKILVNRFFMLTVIIFP